MDMQLPPETMLNPVAWAAATFGTADLADRRRTRRVVEVAACMAAAPGKSLPAAVGDPAALKGAYRLLHEPAVDVAALVAPHRDATLTAARAQAVVLLVQDTTEVDYTAHRATTGLGPIGNGGGRGYLLQSVLAITPTPRQILGLAHLEAFLRVPAPRRGERSDQRRTRPRESDVWARAVAAIGAPPPARHWVHVADAGADVFTFFQQAQDTGTDLLVRVVQDRRATTAQGDATHLQQALRAAPVRATRSLELAAQPRRAARTAELAVAWEALTLQPPAGMRGEPIPAWVVRAWEPAPPATVAEPLEWLLLTTVPVTDPATAWERVDWYAARWVVEEYHRCLKTGCRLEESQLRDGDALWRLLGLQAPVAVRLLQLRDLARDDPDRPARAVVGAAAVAVVAAATRRSAAGMTVATFWALVARMGGHQGRRGDGPPGWQTLWRGWLKLQTLLDGVHLAHSLPELGCG